MKKGVSLAALMATITIIVILISTVTISGKKMSDNVKKSNFALEINSIQQSVDSYVEKNNGMYPITNSVVVNLSDVSDENKEQFTNNGEMISGNTISLFEINYNDINFTKLKYGNKEEGNTDVYLVSAITGKVYYAKGFKIGSKVYYTLTDELKKSINYQTTESIVNN